MDPYNRARIVFQDDASTVVIYDASMAYLTFSEFQADGWDPIPSHVKWFRVGRQLRESMIFKEVVVSICWLLK